MRHWVLDRQAEADLQSQLDYLIERGAVEAAERLARTGIFLDYRGLWETWIPRTRLVLWYRFTDIELQVPRIWHTSQDRRSAPG